MQAMTTIQGNLAAVAKELDMAHKRVDKIKSGKGHARNIGDATSGAEAINREWESQAPYVFEQLQALDENRINHLRDVLTQLQTHEVDHVERSRVSAESCLNALLSVDTKEEISTFVARTSAGTPTMQPPPRSRMASGNTLAAPVPSRGQDDRASEVSAASEGPFGSGSAGAGGPPRECWALSADSSVALPVLIISSHANSRTQASWLWLTATWHSYGQTEGRQEARRPSSFARKGETIETPILATKRNQL